MNTYVPVLVYMYFFKKWQVCSSSMALKLSSEQKGIVMQEVSTNHYVSVAIAAMIVYISIFLLSEIVLQNQLRHNCK